MEKIKNVADLNPKVLNHQNGSLFLGVGVVTSKNISIGVPFDILGMFFEAEILKQSLGLNKVIVLIGDTHAKSNKTFPEQKIDLITQRTKRTLEKVIKNFNLDHFQLFMASELFKLPEFQQIFTDLPDFPNMYLKHEIADCLWFEKKEKLILKLGWTMQKGSDFVGHDERFFDKEIKKFCPNLSFVHLKPGHTFNKNRPRVSLYLSIFGEKRILLKKNENVKEKIEKAIEEWNDRSLGGGINHLAAIVRAFEVTDEPLFNMTLAQKIEFILKKSIR